jgi:hypothetical protein
MNPMAAQVQALLADQTDGQLTQGSAASIHTIPNSTGLSPAPGQQASAGGARYNVAQYTPSAQDAATGAYSAPRQQPAQAAPVPQCAPQVQCAPAKPSAARSAAKKRKATQAKAAHPAAAETPTVAGAPAQEPTPQPSAPQLLAPSTDLAAPPEPAAASTTGLTDEELQQHNLPPLRGPWIRLQRQPNPLSPRDEAEMQLRSIEASYSAWLGGAGLVNYRSGALGYDHLAALEAPFEASVAMGYNARLVVVAKPVFLDSGQADGSSTLTVIESTTAGSSLISIPQPIGTLTTTAATPPAQQNAAGLGGEIQLVFPHLAIAGGYTPANFLVATFTARAQWKPGPFTFSVSRDSVKDTQLSYAGLRDPAGDTLGGMGQIWGGVVANQGNVQYSKGGAESGFYLGAGGQYLAGYTVETNTRIDGSGGAYWRVKTCPSTAISPSARTSSPCATRTTKTRLPTAWAAISAPRHTFWPTFLLPGRATT